jgi:putative NADH-flavin reductase
MRVFVVGASGAIGTRLVPQSCPTRCTMYAVAPSTSKLADLKARGVLTDEEFERAKATVLAY